jgi:hypothetical protein
MFAAALAIVALSAADGMEWTVEVKDASTDKITATYKSYTDITVPVGSHLCFVRPGEPVRLGRTSVWMQYFEISCGKRSDRG